MHFRRPLHQTVSAYTLHQWISNIQQSRFQTACRCLEKLVLPSIFDTTHPSSSSGPPHMWQHFGCPSVISSPYVCCQTARRTRGVVISASDGRRSPTVTVFNAIEVVAARRTAVYAAEVLKSSHQSSPHLLTCRCSRESFLPATRRLRCYRCWRNPG